jgi:glycosyltransferase involved in cell wall biosynthesis
MVEQIITLLQNPEKREKIGQTAWEFVNRNLSIERVSQIIADEFNS